MRSVQAAAITIYVNTSVGKINVMAAHYTHTLQVISQVAVLPCVFKICMHVCVCAYVCRLSVHKWLVRFLTGSSWLPSWLHLIWTCSLFSPSFFHELSHNVSVLYVPLFHRHTYYSICHSNEFCVCVHMHVCVPVYLGGLLCSKVKPAGNVISLN